MNNQLFPIPGSRCTRRQFLTRTAAGTALLMVGPRALAQKRPLNPIALTPSNRHPDTISRVTVASPERISILQLTDIHFFNDRSRLGPGPDDQTLSDVKRMIDHCSPDLLAFTGDTWHDNPDGRGAEFLDYSLSHIQRLGIPWLWVWGNHDQLDDYVAGHDALTSARHSLYRGGPQAGNYTIDIVDTAGRRLWELICLNTTNLGIQRPQRDWIDALRNSPLRIARKQPPAFCILHIPVLQYDYVWQEELASGLKRETVCSWGENGSGLWHLQQLGTVKALFCGHDHVNDYSGSVEEIELVYGRATGHAGYGADEVRKGAKLITANATTGTYTWVTLFPDGTSWRPPPGFRTEKVIDAPWMRHVTTTAPAAS